MNGTLRGAVPMLFLDRDICSRKLEDALSSAGIAFATHRDHFEKDTPDEAWIPQVGQCGWWVLTRDQRIRHRPNELAAVRAASLHMFVLTSGNLSSAETAELVCRAWPKMRAAAAETRPPAIWSVTRAGEVKLLKR